MQLTGGVTCKGDLFYVLWISGYLESVQIKEEWPLFSFNETAGSGLADYWVEGGVEDLRTGVSWVLDL